MQIERKRSLKRLNTLGLEAIADHYVTLDSIDEAVDFFRSEEFKNLPHLILGAGSNTLFSKDFKGVVIHPNMREISIVKIVDDKILVRVGAGVNWDNFVEWCVDRGWGGAENLSWIPGCVGASPVQNIGAYGSEAADIIENVEFIYLDSGELRFLKGHECLFGYRESIFKKDLKNKVLIAYVTFSLSLKPSLNINYADVKDELRGEPYPSLRDVRDAIIKIRRRKLPDPGEIGNAGSFFKNPVIDTNRAEELKREFPSLKLYPSSNGGVKLPAAWLIEQCGFKGVREGNVGVHKNQALVLIAYDGANAGELLCLAQKIKRSVKDRFDVDIEPEVNII